MIVVGDIVYIGDNIFIVNHVMEADVILYPFRVFGDRFQKGQYIAVAKKLIAAQDEDGVYIADNNVQFVPIQQGGNK